MAKVAGAIGCVGVGVAVLTLLGACGESRSGGDVSRHDSARPGGGGAGGEPSEPDSPPGGQPGGAGAGGAEPQEAVLSERSFAVTASVELVDPEAAATPRGCTSFDFTARFERTAEGGWALVAAAGREQSGAGLEASGSDYRAVAVAGPWRDRYLDQSVALELKMGECCEHLELSSLTLSPEAATDGTWDGFTAAGAGVASSAHCGGDAFLEDDVRVTLKAGPDRSAPRVLLPTSAVHPFDGFDLPFSEVVRGETRATLTDSQQVTLPFERYGAVTLDGPFWGFRARPMMSFGRSVTLELEGEDLAGNAFDGGGVIHSVEDPGVQTADGFESDVTVLAESELRLVSQGAISGSRSLQVGNDYETSGRVTFHLHAEEPSQVVRFAAQSLRWHSGEDDVVGVRARAAVLGGNEIVTLDVPLYDPPEAAQTAEIPPVDALELALPEPTTDAIVTFDLAPHGEECGLASCDEIPALIDDLRLE